MKIVGRIWEFLFTDRDIQDIDFITKMSSKGSIKNNIKSFRKLYRGCVSSPSPETKLSTSFAGQYIYLTPNVATLIRILQKDVPRHAIKKIWNLKSWW